MRARRAVGVDLGGTKLLAGVVDSQQTVSHRVTFPSPTTAESMIEEIVEAIELVRAQVDHDVVAAGLGIPCMIDQQSGVALGAVNLPITNLPVRALVEEQIGIPVFVDNDANLATLAEHQFGAARGFAHAVLLTVGTGIGGGLVLNGEIYRGSTGAGPELGHMVLDLEGPPCHERCPLHRTSCGCFEMLVSGPAIAVEASAQLAKTPSGPLAELADGPNEFTGAAVTELALQGDPTAAAAVEAVGTRLGAGIASLINALNPEIVVVGGGVIAAGELLLRPARAEVTRRALPQLRKGVKIVAARFGPDAGLVGAATFALQGSAGSKS